MASQRPFCVCGSQRRTTIERSRGRSGQLSRQLQTDRIDWLTCQSDGGNELRWPRLERRHASLVSRIMVIETKLLGLRLGSPPRATHSDVERRGTNVPTRHKHQQLQQSGPDAGGTMVLATVSCSALCRTLGLGRRWSHEAH
jgi:hypothetical protein